MTEYPQTPPEWDAPDMSDEEFTEAADRDEDRKIARLESAREAKAERWNREHP
jgi:hypothetical protein